MTLGHLDRTRKCGTMFQVSRMGGGGILKHNTTNKDTLIIAFI